MAAAGGSGREPWRPRRPRFLELVSYRLRGADTFPDRAATAYPRRIPLLAEAWRTRGRIPGIRAHSSERLSALPGGGRFHAAADELNRRRDHHPSSGLCVGPDTVLESRGSRAPRLAWLSRRNRVRVLARRTMGNAGEPAVAVAAGTGLDLAAVPVDALPVADEPA